MRKIMISGFAALLAVVAIGTWATANTRSVTPPDHAVGIKTFEMMINAKDLPVHQFDMS